MARSRYPIIARQGWVPIAIATVGGILSWHFLDWLWALPWLGVVLLVAYLFRDPYRAIPSTPLGVVSPADGLVEAVESLHDPYLDREAVRIILSMRGGDVYTTRSPVEGKIMDMLQAPTEAGASSHGVWIKTDENDDIVIVMSRGRLHNAPRCFVQCGDRVGQGQRCGFINFGSRVEIYLPVNSRVDVNVGDHIQGGTDLLGVLIHKAG